MAFDARPEPPQQDAVEGAAALELRGADAVGARGGEVRRELRADARAQAAEAMTAYCTADEFAAFTAHLSLDVPADVGALLDRAAHDVDAFLGLAVAPGGGDRIDVGALSVGQRGALIEATAEQAAFRLILGEEDAVEGAPRILGAGGLAFAPSAPDMLGPQPRRILAGAGLLRHTGTVTAPT